MQTLAIYLHWPFCKSKCPYCDFNSHVRDHIDEAAWQQAFMTELRRLHSDFSDRRISSIFFGGGTPSLMAPGLVMAIIDEITNLWNLTEACEITIEANPTSVELAKLKDFKRAGVNRLSMGIQSFSAADLKFLGREHSVEEAKAALEMAQSTFDRFSFDLIYARPQQTLEAWQQELELALRYQTNHLSLYQLTIESNTAFATRFARGDFQLPPEDVSTDLFDYTVSRLKQQGLEHYEISNFAKPGHESQHNLTYWRYQDYAGIGPGAHGRLSLSPTSKIGTKQYRAPETWLKRVSEHSGYDEKVEISLKEQATEMLLMGLRLAEPFDVERLPIPATEALNMIKLNALKEAHFLDYDQRFIRLAPQARRCLDEILRYIVC